MDKPRVKPLVWAESIAQISYFAKSCVGEYRITKTRNTRNDKWQVNYLDANRRSHVVGYIGGIESAKAAAQADYEARILAAIDPAPVSVREAARALLGHTPKITAKPLAEMSEAMKIDAHPAILLRGFCAALRAIAEAED